MKNNQYNISIIIGLATICVLLTFCLIFCGLNAQSTQNELQSALEQINSLNEANDNLNSEINNKNTELENIKVQLDTTIQDLAQLEGIINEQNITVSNLNQEIIRLQESLFGKGQDLDIIITQSDVEMIAKTVWGEARGQSTMEQAAVIWCILNRVDRGDGTIAEVITKPNQFVGYSKNNPATDKLCALAKDVLARWQMEKVCTGDVGRVLPNNYYYFYGDGKDNHFRDKYKGDYTIWNWDCWDPYS